jgi:molecular chaperone HtpG
LKQIKTVLGEQVKEVRITHRLTESPACLVADEQDMNSHMQRLLKSAGQAIPTTPPIFELNPEHPLIVKLKEEQDDHRFTELTHVLYDQAKLAEGASLEDPAQFVRRLNSLLLEMAG